MEITEKYRINLFSARLNNKSKERLFAQGLDCNCKIIEDYEDEKLVEFDNGVTKIIADFLLIKI